MRKVIIHNDFEAAKYKGQRIVISKDDLDWLRVYMPKIDDCLHTGDQYDFDCYVTDCANEPPFIVNEKKGSLWQTVCDIMERVGDDNPYLPYILCESPYCDDDIDFSATPEEMEELKRAHGIDLPPRASAR